MIDKMFNESFESVDSNHMENKSLDLPLFDDNESLHTDITDFEMADESLYSTGINDMYLLGIDADEQDDFQYYLDNEYDVTMYYDEYGMFKD